MQEKRNPRLHEIAALAGRLKAGDLSARATPSGSDRLLDELVTSLNIIGEKLAAGQEWRESTEARLSDVVEVIVAVAALDFSRHATVSERADTLDAVAAGLNMLQEELQHSMVSRSYLDSIMRSMVDVLVVADTTGRIQNANPAALALLGCGIDELRDRQLSTLWADPTAAPQVPDIIVRGAPITVETRLRRRDGAAVPVHCSVALIRDDSGVATGIVYAARDITERQQAEAQVREQNEFNALRAEIWKLAADKSLGESQLVQGLLDRVGPAIRVSRACYNTYPADNRAGGDLACTQEWCAEGVKPSLGSRLPTALSSPLLEQRFAVLTHEKALTLVPSVLRPVAEPVLRALESLLDLEAVMIVPYRAEGALQGVFTFDVCKRRAQEPSGPDVVKRIVDEVLAIVAQNLAQRKAEEALNRAKEAAEELAAQAQAANQAKSEFISVVSHEIRTPVTAIVGMTQALEMSGLTGEQPVLVKVMREAEDVLMSLLNNVLDLSRAETGRVVLEDICFDLRRLVRQRAELITEQARQGGTAITWSVDNDVPQQVRGDPSRLGQVLMNLLGNAVKFTQRGRIDLRVHAHEGAGGLLFSVSDTGIGIPADRIDAVFEPFMQADASTTRKYGGSGLGLAICRRLVELMGGRIWVESEVGTGSTFHFTVLLGPC